MTERPSDTHFEGNEQGVVISNEWNETTLDTQDGNAIQLQQQITAKQPNGIIPEGEDQLIPEGEDQTTLEGEDQTILKGEDQTTPDNKQGHPAALDAILLKIKLVAEKAKQEQRDDEKAQQTEQASINWGAKLSKDEKATIVPMKEVNNSRIITDPNILHEIARRGDEFGSYNSFVKWLLGLRKLSNILLQQKSKLYHRRPLQLALENENSDFVKTIIDNFKDRTSFEKGDGGDNLTLATLLRPDSPKAVELNCIHLVIEARSPHTIDIIDACEGFPEIFMQRDSERRQETPLHLAAVSDVTAESRSPSENRFNALDVVKKLIEMCPDALYAMNTDGETPYRSRIRALGNKTAAGAGRASQVYSQGQNGKQQSGGKSGV